MSGLGKFCTSGALIDHGRASAAIDVGMSHWDLIHCAHNYLTRTDVATFFFAALEEYLKSDGARE